MRFGILIILLVPLFFLNIRDSHDWGDDFAQYILQAKNLAEGKPQSEGTYVFNPDFARYAPPLYPVGYPLLLAPVYAFFGNDLLAFNYFQTFLLFIFSVALFFFLRKFMDEVPALLLTLIAAYNPWMLEFKAEILADLPFSLFILLSIMAYMNFRKRMNLGNALLTGCLTAFAMLVKPLALVLIVAMTVDSLVVQIRQKGFDRTAITKQVVLLLTPFLVYFFVMEVVVPSAMETTAHFQGLYDSDEKLNKRFNINAEYYMHRFQDLFKFTNPDWNLFTIVLKAFALTLLLLGFFGQLFSRFGFLEIFMLLYLLMVLFFPDASQGFRYLLPLLPLMLLYVYHGFESIRLERMNRKVVFIVGCLFCLFQYKTSIENIWRQGDYVLTGPQEPAARQAFEFIENNTAPNAVIVCFKPRALALYTGRKALTNHPQQEPEDMDGFFEKSNVSYYLLLTDRPNAGLEKYLAEKSDSVKMIWRNEKFVLYKKR